MLDLAVIGAGPCGLAAGVAAKRAGLRASVFDKGAIVSSLLKYPLYMTFFSTAERLEIAGVPFVTSGEKPTRREALTYYRKVAEYFQLDVRQYHEVLRVRAGRARAEPGRGRTDRCAAPGVRDRILRISQSARRPRGGPAARIAFLRRGAPVLAA